MGLTRRALVGVSLLPAITKSAEAFGLGTLGRGFGRMGSAPPPSSSILFRSPSSNDDTNKGYSIGSYWVKRGTREVYKATAVTAGHATWQLQASYIGPICDQISTAPAAAYGMIKLVAAYAGSCCRIQRASDSTEQDIGFVAGSFGQSIFDAASAATFIGASSAIVVKWYDQSGNALDAVNGTNAPKLTTNTVNGYRAITFDRPYAIGTAQSFTLPAGLSVDRQAFSTLFVGQITAPSKGTTVSIRLGSDASFSNNQMEASLNQGFLQSVPGSVFTSTQIEATPSAITMASDATSQRSQMNEVSDTGAAQSSITLTGGAIGLWATNGPYTLQAEGLATVIYGSVLSAADLLTLKLASYANFGITPQVRDRLVLVGDSITAGADAIPDQGFWVQAYPNLSRPYQVFNNGATGQTAAFHNTNYASGIASLYRSTNRNVMFVHIGTNDINAGTDATTLYNAIKALCDSGRATGFKVIVSTILPRTNTGLPGGGAAFDVVRLAVNASITANWTTFADALADFGGHPIMGPIAACADTTLYTSALHPTALGASYLAILMQPAINVLG